MTLARGHGLISLVPTVYGFGEFLENLKHSEDQVFLITPIFHEAHAMVYTVGDGTDVNVPNCSLST